MGLDPVPPGLTVDWLLGQFAKTKSVARQRYAAFVLAGVGQPSPWEGLKGQVLLGGEAFVEKLAPTIGSSEAKREIPKRQRKLHRPALKQLLGAPESREARNRAMAKAYLEHGYTLSEIGREAGLHYATVSRIIKSVEKCHNTRCDPNDGARCDPNDGDPNDGSRLPCQWCMGASWRSVAVADRG
jgi:hypothetical protein